MEKDKFWEERISVCTKLSLGAQNQRKQELSDDLGVCILNNLPYVTSLLNLEVRR